MIPLFEVHPIELVIQSQPFIKGGGGDGGDGGGGEDKGETKIKDEVGGAIDRISSAKGPSPSQWNVIGPAGDTTTRFSLFIWSFACFELGKGGFVHVNGSIRNKCMQAPRGARAARSSHSGCIVADCARAVPLAARKPARNTDTFFARRARREAHGTNLRVTHGVFNKFLTECVFERSKCKHYTVAPFQSPTDSTLSRSRESRNKRRRGDRRTTPCAFRRLDGSVRRSLSAGPAGTPTVVGYRLFSHLTTTHRGTVHGRVW